MVENIWLGGLGDLCPGYPGVSSGEYAVNPLAQPGMSPAQYLPNPLYTGCSHEGRSERSRKSRLVDVCPCQRRSAS